MKLGTLKEGGRDGTLIVVNRELTRAVRAAGIAPTLQKAIEDNAVTPNVVVASNIDDVLPDDEDGEAAPAPQEKPKQPKDDDQLRRAIEVLKART